MRFCHSLSCFVLVVAAVTGGLARPASATSVRYRSLRELVRTSDATILGRATNHASRWEQGRIVTQVTVEVDEVWAGGVGMPTRIEVITPGGVVGTIGQRVDGAASLPLHGRVVLHLRGHNGAYIPAGMAQGVWWVDTIVGQDGAIHRMGSDRLVMASKTQRPESPPDSLRALRLEVMEAARAR